MLPREMKVIQPDLANGNVAEFVKRNYHHFNARALVDATESYIQLIEDDGCMLVSMAGAMSTAEIGISLAEMIRQDKVHAISCTGANLEEDVFNLIAHDSYVQLPDYKDLTPDDEKALMDNHLNRVTDTAIPESTAMSVVENKIIALWKSANELKQKCFPHEYLYKLLLHGKLEKNYQIDPRDSWMLAAAEKNLPIFVPGWEDSTLGNVFTAMVIQNETKLDIMKTGIEYMISLVDWYRKTSKIHPMGFFQIGGGIAGDFAICAVPLLQQDLKEKDTKLWEYFCQISDSTTSYGSYSGAVPNEKITWGKLTTKSKSFVIESDASIVAPLIFDQILGL